MTSEQLQEWANGVTLAITEKLGDGVKVESRALMTTPAEIVAQIGIGPDMRWIQIDMQGESHPLFRVSMPIPNLDIDALGSNTAFAAKMAVERYSVEVLGAARA